MNLLCLSLLALAHVGEASKGPPCRPVKCHFTPWKWSSCTKSCGGGTQIGSRAISIRAGVINSHLPPCPGKSCSGLKSSSRPCNTKQCPPQNCVLTAWSEWKMCSKTCEGGTTYRTRKVANPARYGGKPCSLTRRESSACNAHPCKYGTCSSDAISCDVYQYKHKNGAYWDAKTAKYGGKQTTCNVGSKYWSKQAIKGKNLAGRQKNCHMCDTSYECSLKNVGYTVRVQHLKKFMFFKSDYSCKMKDHATKSCECRCKMHPTGCFKKGFGFRHKPLKGGTFKANRINECSTMCAHHPGCKFWEFNSKTKSCSLKGACGKKGNGCYVKRASAYAGMTPSGAQGCVVAPSGMTNFYQYLRNQCGPGTYTVVSNRGKFTEQTSCRKCPSGKYNDIPGRAFCVHEDRIHLNPRKAGETIKQWFTRLQIHKSHIHYEPSL